MDRGRGNAYNRFAGTVTGVTPYRLEMQAKLRNAGHKNLYDFWGDALYREVMDESRVVINLASKEYSRCVQKYLQQGDRFITCVFGVWENDRVVQKGVYAKMARGEMVRFMADIQARNPEQLKEFSSSGYCFDEKRSSDTEYIFLREAVPGQMKARKTMSITKPVNSLI